MKFVKVLMTLLLITTIFTPFKISASEYVDNNPYVVYLEEDSPNAGLLLLKDDLSNSELLFELETRVKEALLNGNTRIELYDLLIHFKDYPLLSRINNNIIYIPENITLQIYVYNSGECSHIVISNVLPKQQVQEHFNKVDNEIKKILACVDSSMTQVEKALVVHDYIIQQYAYDYDRALNNTLPQCSFNPSGFFMYDTGVCEAYGNLFMYIMLKLGIETDFTAGNIVNGRTTHLWNIIKLDGKYYHVDTTWDDPVYDRLGQVQHNYFLLSDRAIASYRGSSRQTHTNWQRRDLTCSDKRYDDYWWYGVESQIVIDGDYYYYANDNKLLRRHRTTNKVDSLVSLGRWYYRHNNFWMGTYSGVFKHDGKIYYNTANDIYTYDIQTGKSNKVKIGNIGDHCIFGIMAKDHTLYYAIGDNPNEKATIKSIELSTKPTIENITINQTNIELYVNDSITLSYTLAPSNVDMSKETLTWTSSNTNVVTVDNGKVTAKGVGTATVTVSSANQKNASCTVLVKERVHEHVFKNYVSNNDATTEQDGTKTAKCERCDETDTIIDEGSKLPIPEHKHSYATKVTNPTCNDKGYTTYTCECGDSYKDNYTNSLGHKAVVDKAIAATCTQTGLTEGKHCSRCNTVLVKQETVKALNHSFKNYVSDNNATTEKDGTKTANCEYCNETHTVTDVGSKLPPKPSKPVVEGANRVFGSSRYETAFKVADTLKTTLGVDKFDAVIVANGTNFADALAGSYLSAKKNAPILMTDKKNTNINNLVKYIKSNLRAGGTVYILGGTAALPSKVDKQLYSNYYVKRLAGNDRYATNLLILEEAGVTNEDLLVCTGTNFADSLSASAAGRPMLLVGKTLNASQVQFLQSLNGNRIYVVGGTGAVNTGIEKAVKRYGEVTRLAGASRYQTSVLVAETFVEDPISAVVAYGQNFPDGLSGGALAYALQSPLLLAENKQANVIGAYTAKYNIKDGYVLGGSGLISEASKQKILNK